MFVCTARRGVCFASGTRATADSLRGWVEVCSVDHSYVVVSLASSAVGPWA